LGSQNSYFSEVRAASPPARTTPTTVPGPKHPGQNHPVNLLHGFLDRNSGFPRIPSRASPEEINPNREGEPFHLRRGLAGRR